MSKDIPHINLATADAVEMKNYAKEHLELRLTLTMSEDTMRQRILKKAEEIGVQLQAAEIEGGTAAVRAQTKKFEILVQKQDRPGGSENALVGVQGKLYSIPRNVPIIVPAAVVEVLKNGVQDFVTQDDNGDIHKESVPTYPFQIVREIDTAAA